MKRLHIHMGVDEIESSVKFYSVLFNAEPVKLKSDYAKWVVEDPSINFAISTKPSEQGLNHLGIQVDQAEELGEIPKRLKDADMATFAEGETVCCYAQSDKTWVTDPAKVAWETYTMMDDAELYYDKTATTTDADACCTPETKGQPDCCVPSNLTQGCCN